MKGVTNIQLHVVAVFLLLYFRSFYVSIIVLLFLWFYTANARCSKHTVIFKHQPLIKVRATKTDGTTMLGVVGLQRPNHLRLFGR